MRTKQEIREDPLYVKILEVYGIPDHEDGSIAIEKFVPWFTGTEDVALMALERLNSENFGENHSVLVRLSEKLRDVHECGTSSLMYTYFLEFAAAWLGTLSGRPITVPVSIHE